MEDYSAYIPKNEEGKTTLQGLFFNNPSNTAKELYLYPLWGAEYEVNYTYHIDRHYMNSYILFLIEKGKLYFTFDNNQRFTASENSIVLMDCRKRNQYHAESNCRFMFFHFNGVQVQTLYDYLTQNQQHLFTSTNHLTNLFIQLMNLLSKNEFTGNDLHYSELLYEILINMTATDITELDRSILHQTPEIIKRAIAYLDTHYNDSVTIEELCRKLNISATRLSKEFKTYTSTSIHHYLMLVRLSHAQQLLTSRPDLSISEIAPMCGFHDSSHLNKTFDKEIEMTPSKFRKLCF
ncbi:AraC family transcriptional regulator [Lactobacillus sp. LC28-10]|uniref:AraC family transcriptional regulator n=1 Tax=Secundilactobacillus angelensis TaxID=2722706 RepID=A0ABX1KXA6_9LACO|nr:AraC family transcriptional regulator [Secundilactobacillus angelensis]MCH5461745.1 AraC family transcriptional regulator [Secundilactobacillus angelensis]NLR18584.1 AraC family transcriptional regulator [Secundilactobacillus angelensis]